MFRIMDVQGLQAALDAKQVTITFGTGVQTALGVNIGTAGSFVVNGGALGTPSSGALDNCTLPTPVVTALAFNTGWGNVGSGYASGGYSKSKDGMVSLQGLVAGAGGATTALIATLPAGFRPAANRIFPSTYGGAFDLVTVETDGKISLFSGNNANYVALDGIHFYV